LGWTSEKIIETTEGCKSVVSVFIFLKQDIVWIVANINNIGTTESKREGSSKIIRQSTFCTNHQWRIRGVFREIYEYFPGNKIYCRNRYSVSMRKGGSRIGANKTVDGS